MLGQLSEFIVRVTNLLEAEGKVARGHVNNLLDRLFWLIVASVLLSVGVLMVAYAAWELCRRAPAALLVIGLAVVLFGTAAYLKFQAIRRADP